MSPEIGIGDGLDSGDQSFIIIEQRSFSASMLRLGVVVVGKNKSKVNFGILYENKWGPQLPVHSRDMHDGFSRAIEYFP